MDSSPFLRLHFCFSVTCWTPHPSCLHCSNSFGLFCKHTTLLPSLCYACCCFFIATFRPSGTSPSPNPCPIQKCRHVIQLPKFRVAGSTWGCFAVGPAISLVNFLFAPAPTASFPFFFFFFFFCPVGWTLYWTLHTSLRPHLLGPHTLGPCLNTSRWMLTASLMALHPQRPGCLATICEPSIDGRERLCL